VVVQVYYGRGSHNARSDGVQYVQAAAANNASLVSDKVYTRRIVYNLKTSTEYFESQQARSALVIDMQEFLVQLSNAFLLFQVFFVNFSLVFSGFLPVSFHCIVVFPIFLQL
jgi:hypothetical protein